MSNKEEDELPPVVCNLKSRRGLKGHRGRVLHFDWSNDKIHLMSAGQVCSMFTLSDICRELVNFLLIFCFYCCCIIYFFVCHYFPHDIHLHVCRMDLLPFGTCCLVRRSSLSRLHRRMSRRAPMLHRQRS